MFTCIRSLIKNVLTSSMVLLLALQISTTHASAKNPFIDLPPDHPHYQAIIFVQEEGIVQGYKDKSFKPDQKINRAEFLKIIVESIVGQTPLEHAGQCFNDVSSGMWFYPYVCYAERVGWVNGFPDGNFKPSRNLQFAEASKILANAYDMNIKSSKIWFKPSIDALAEFKAIPMEIKSFSQDITRGQMAEIIYRLQVGNTQVESRSFESLSY